jgi:uncharacterized alpha/beta hydrolase family protein
MNKENKPTYNSLTLETLESIMKELSINRDIDKHLFLGWSGRGKNPLVKYMKSKNGKRT